jgi:hypothetical protein
MRLLRVPRHHTIRSPRAYLFRPRRPRTTTEHLPLAPDVASR